MKTNKIVRIMKEINDNSNKIHVGLSETVNLGNFNSKKYESSVWLCSIPTVEELNRLYAILRASIKAQKDIDKGGIV
jgi:hypothetical protein